MKLAKSLGLSLFLFSAVAAAQGADASAPPPPPPPPPCEDCDDAYKWGDLRGFTIQAGGGMEGYTGSLAPRIRPGGAWDVVMQIKPTSVLGIELAYEGGANRFNSDRLDGASSTLLRNGGHVAITAGLSATRVQPYMLAGVGVQRYSVDATGESFGYHSTTNGFVPLGAGIRAIFLGKFTMDLRGTYNFDFGDTIYSSLNTSSVAGVTTSLTSAGRWRASLMIGYTF